MTRPPATTSAENSARYLSKRGASASVTSDGIEIPRGTRRVVLDLAPETVEAILDMLLNARTRDQSIEHLLIAALEKAR